MPALSVKKRSQRGANHAWRAFFACRLGLELFAQASTLSPPLLPFKPLRGKMQPIVD